MLFVNGCGNKQNTIGIYVFERSRRTSELQAELVIQVSNRDGLVGQAVLDENVGGLSVKIEKKESRERNAQKR